MILLTSLAFPIERMKSKKGSRPAFRAGECSWICNKRKNKHIHESRLIWQKDECNVALLCQVLNIAVSGIWGSSKRESCTTKGWMGLEITLYFFKVSQFSVKTSTIIKETRWAGWAGAKCHLIMGVHLYSWPRILHFKNNMTIIKQHVSLFSEKWRKSLHHNEAQFVCEWDKNTEWSCGWHSEVCIITFSFSPTPWTWYPQLVPPSDRKELWDSPMSSSSQVILSLCGCHWGREMLGVITERKQLIQS